MRRCACLRSLTELTEAEVRKLWYMSTEQDTQTRKWLHVALKDVQHDNIIQYISILNIIVGLGILNHSKQSRHSLKREKYKNMSE